VTAPVTQQVCIADHPHMGGVRARPSQTGEQSMKLVVIVSNFGAAANVGGCVDTEAKIFDLPEEIADYIRKSRTGWTSISLAFSDETEENKA